MKPRAMGIRKGGGVGWVICGRGKGVGDCEGLGCVRKDVDMEEFSAEWIGCFQRAG
jgi:hypothetical protein